MNSGFIVTLSGYRTYDTANDTQSASFAPALLNDFVWVGLGEAPLSFTISNLLPGGVYDLYLYSLHFRRLPIIVSD